MYNTESINEHSEDQPPPKSTEHVWTVTNFPDQLSTLELQQILRDTSEHGEAKGTVLPKEEKTLPQSIYIPCPPQGTLNKIITNGM
nr:sodium/hydrogen exchanger 9B1-like [Loxodonta africana]